jgi:hypothetical protein
MICLALFPFKETGIQTLIDTTNMLDTELDVSTIINLQECTGENWGRSLLATGNNRATPLCYTLWSFHLDAHAQTSPGKESNLAI